MRRSFTVRTVTAISALGLILASVGCGNEVAGPEAVAAPEGTTSPPLVDDGTKEPPIGDIIKVTGPGEISMPLDPFISKMDEKDLLLAARNRVTTKCMHELGYGFWNEEINLEPVLPVSNQDRLEFFDPENAAEKGYPKSEVASPRPNPAALAAQSRPGFEDAVKAFNGELTESLQTPSGRSVPKGGCIAEAILAINGQQELVADPRDLAIEAQNAAMRDSRYRAADADWKKCMDKAGYSYARYIDARIDPRWSKRTATESAGTEEKTVATADATCQLESNIVGVYKTLRRAYEQQFLDENREGLEKSVTIYATWVENARKVLS